MTYSQQNRTSFTLASMMASPVFFRLRFWGVAEQHRSTLCMTLV